MVMEQLKTAVSEILKIRPSVKSEAATKQSLVLPMLEALGYDTRNPTKVCPEHDADVAIKKYGQKEKVDFAILVEDIPRIYVEVKAVDESLDRHEGQLSRYFDATLSVRLAILTNGIEYRFFTDTENINKMDTSPFYIVKLDAKTDHGLEFLARFHKSVFSPDVIRDFATELKYKDHISNFLKTELDLGERNPSKKFVRWILEEEASYKGKVSTDTIERFQPIIKDALQMLLRDIALRTVTELDKEVISPSVQTQSDQEQPITATVSQEESAEISESEKLMLFDMVKAIFDSSKFAKAEICDDQTLKKVPVEILYKNISNYFTIYLNKPAFWIIRLNPKESWIGINVKLKLGLKLVPSGFKRIDKHSYAEFRLEIKNIHDIKSLRKLVLAAFQQTIDDRK